MRSHDLALGLALAATALACETSGPTAPGSPGPAAAAGAAPAAAQRTTTLALSPLGDLVEQWTAAPGNLFLRRPRPDFGQYETIRVESPAVYYSDGVTPPIPADTLRLRKAFQAAMVEELGSATGLPVSERRGPGVLVILSEASNVDLDRNRNGLGQSRVTSIIQPSGNVFFVVEVADDATGTPLVRFAMRRPLPGGIFTGPWWPELDRARQLFLQFAQDAGNGLGVVFGTGEETASDSG